MADDDPKQFDNFSDSALIGQVVSISLLMKLLDKGVISRDDALYVFDDALQRLEEWQGHFPNHEPYFVIARATLSEFVDAVRPKMKK